MNLVSHKFHSFFTYFPVSLYFNNSSFWYPPQVIGTSYFEKNILRSLHVLAFCYVLRFHFSQCTLAMSDATMTMTGTCYSQSECYANGGVANGNCASGEFCGLGSMLWTQFSAIFANFRRECWRFSHRLLIQSNFAKIGSSVIKKYF
jgi:hypothetical protein